LPAGDTLHSVWLAGNRCHFVLLDKDESCPTADLTLGRPSGPAYSTGELLNTPKILVNVFIESFHVIWFMSLVRFSTMFWNIHDTVYTYVLLTAALCMSLRTILCNTVA